MLKLGSALTGIAIGLVSSPTIAQEATVSSNQTTSDTDLAENGPTTDTPASQAKSDIIVVGIRGSVASAANKKKNAKQIVDSVVSEDAGKLPDNNVVEALSRVTGVQIDRARGQGQGIAIRGLSGVQTTINGNNANLGSDRSLNLADIPAELVKSVDVYKTRTADQVEGSIAGTVNVELRRPLDLKKGWTIAGSARGAYDDVAKKISPFGSLLVGNRFDTGIGEIGFLVNGSWTRTNYREAYIESESPDVVCCEGDANSAWGRLPASQKSIVIPYRAQYGLEEGRVDRPSLNVALQWKPNDRFDFVLEGQYIGSSERRQVDRLYALTREFGSTISNVTLQPDGQTVRSLTVSQANGIPVGIDSIYNRIKSDFYQGNFETHYHGERAEINLGAQYSESTSGNYFVEHLTRPYGLTSATIDFASDQYSRGVPSITLNGVDLSDVRNYGVERFQDNRGASKNKEFATQADLTLRLSENAILRSAKVGFRFNRRDTNFDYGYRDGFPRVNGAFAPLTGFPGGDQASLTGPPISGAQQWFRIPGAVVYDKISDILNYVQLTDPGSAERFSTKFPSSDQGQVFSSIENNFAAYGQIDYAFDIGIPVDGVIGARYTNTFGTYSSFNFRIVRDTPTGPERQSIERSSGRGNYADILPSATALIHFTPKTQLRLSYTTNVQRPSFYDLRPFYFVNPSQANPIVDAGNPELKAQREYSLNASAEHYFGRGGQISLAGYYKKASNFLYFDLYDAPDLGIYGLPGRSGFVRQQRNAGDGTFVGVEGTVQSFFDFLPGIFKNFGASLNGSLITKARVEYPYPEDFPGAYDSTGTSKYTANAALFYDTPMFSTRVAFNYRSSYRTFIWTENPQYSFFEDDNYRLDAAVNYTPVKFLTLSLEGTNILGNDIYRYFGKQNLLPLGVRVQARTVQASARFRF
jgi:TonB-dependent receptor